MYKDKVKKMKESVKKYKEDVKKDKEKYEEDLDEIKGYNNKYMEEMKVVFDK